MKTRKILAVLCAFVLAISAMAAAVSAEESADTTVAEDGDMTPDHVFSRGVWLFTSESGEGTYYIFDDDKSGHTDRADGTGGVPFACEQDGWNITFHFGGHDDTTQAVVAAGDANITLTYEDGTTRTYTVEYIEGADPDTFSVDAGINPTRTFNRGVWLFTAESGEGTYYIFDDDKSGHTDRADGTGGVPFACEQDGWNITFHFGGPDDTTQAVVAAGDASITFTYEDGTTRTYTVEYIEGADPDTFDAGSFVNDNDDPGPLMFRGGIWKYTVKSVDGSVVTEPDGYFRIAEDGKSGEWVDKAFMSEFTLDQSDLSNIKIAINGQDMDGVIQVESDDFDVITAYISIAGNTLLYTFNLVPEDEEDTFIKGFNKSNSAVDAADSKGSPDTGAADVAAVAGLSILAAGAFIAAKKRK